MYYQIYSIFNTYVCFGRFKINGVKYNFRTHASKTKGEAIEKFFIGYQDAVKMFNEEQHIIPIVHIKPTIPFVMRVQLVPGFFQLKLF